MVDQLLDKEELGMPSPALDTRPDVDMYSSQMVDAFNYISKGCSEAGMIPVSEIAAYYAMFEEYMVETKNDFIYLIHIMNQPILKDVKDKTDKASRGK